MTDLKVAVPLTFALALSTIGPNITMAATSDPSEMLKPGSLRNFIGPNGTLIGDRAGTARDDRGVKIRTAQCIYGNWRRC
jgi:hypothetical protein